MYRRRRESGERRWDEWVQKVQKVFLTNHQLMNKEESVRWSWCHEWFGARLAELGFFLVVISTGSLQKVSRKETDDGITVLKELQLASLSGCFVQKHNSSCLNQWMNTKLYIEGSHKVLHLLLDTQNNQNVFAFVYKLSPPPNYNMAAVSSA